MQIVTSETARAAVPVKLAEAITLTIQMPIATSI